MNCALCAVKSIVPPFQLLQLLHCTFAVIIPFFTPVPSKTVMLALELYVGIVSPVDSLGETVTLLPEESVYI
jgi:hypothetical protein